MNKIKIFVFVSIILLMTGCNSTKSNTKITNLKDESSTLVTENNESEQKKDKLKENNVIGVKHYNKKGFYITAEDLYIYELTDLKSKNLVIKKNKLVEVFPEKEINNGYFTCLKVVGSDTYYYTENKEKTILIDLDTQDIEYAKEKMLDFVDGYSTEWGLEDGEYYVQKIIIQSVQYKWINPSETWEPAIKIKDNKAYVSNEDFNSFESYFFLGDINNSLKYFSDSLKKTLPSSGTWLTCGGDRSGGGEIFAIFYDGNSLKEVCAANNCGFQEEYTCIYGKEKVEPEYIYDINFPCYALFTKSVTAYLSQKFNNAPDYEIPANEIEFIDGFYGVKEKNIEQIVKINNLVSNENGIFYEGEYLGKTIWISNKDLPERSVFTSIEQIDEFVGFWNGL